MSKTKDMNRKRKEIIDWAKVKGWVINPSKGFERYVENVFQFGFCPCDSSRPHCPCPESEKEVDEQGYCKCRLFWRDLETFKETLKGGESEQTSEETGGGDGRSGTEEPGG